MFGWLMGKKQVNESVSLIEQAEVLVAGGDFFSAELLLREVFRKNMGSPKATFLLGKALFGLARFEEALHCFQPLLEESPNDVGLYLCTAEAAYRLLDFALAVRIFRVAESLTALPLGAQFMLGTSLLMMGLLPDAESVLLSACKEAPEHPKLNEMLALVKLMGGEWREGFLLYESRIAAAKAHPDSPVARWLAVVEEVCGSIKLWEGESLTNQRILLWMEQGFGDNLMLLRFLPVLQSSYPGVRISLWAYSPLRRLLEQFPGVELIFDTHTPIDGSNFDFHCSLMSLPHRLQLSLETFSTAKPYLTLDPTVDAFWHDQMNRYAGLKVGLAWAGNQSLPLDALRSIPLAQFEKLLNISGVTFFSLQKDNVSSEELADSAFPLVDLMGLCHDFMDTAGLVKHLDLIISVDTSVAHLAGGLGKPVWLLNRFESEWRWMRGCETSVWYPQMRIFNQEKTREWSPVIAFVRNALIRIQQNQSSLII